MNLVEQFGYEKLKEMRGTTQHALLCIGGCEPIHVDDVDLMLLEHRRENNIFEKGDLITLNESDFIYKIDTVNSSGLHATTTNEINRKIIALFEHDTIKHATDKEIAQGYRDE